MFYDVIIKSKTSFLDNKFTYKSDDEIDIGCRVVVPFGRANSLTIAFVIGKVETVDDESKIKLIEEVIDLKPIINQDQIELIYYMVHNNLSDFSSAIQTLMPPGSIDSITEYFSLGINFEELNQEEIEFFNKARTYPEIFSRFGSRYNKKQINDFVEKKILFRDYSKKSKASLRFKYYISKTANDIDLPKNAKVQKEILAYLEENGETEKQDLLDATKASVQSLNSLYEKGCIEVRKEEDYREILDQSIKADTKPKLNSQQEFAVKKILESENNKFLIHGITGSGKTEIYLHLVEEYLKMDKEAIMLVPEISLTPQTIERFQKRFGQDIAVLHSKLSISERYEQWNFIKQNKVKMVVGARSAVFAPFENLGIIIIDEEHENSYKSDKNPKYDAIDIARKRAELSNAKLVLGTATPSIETMYRVYKKEYDLITLTKRATNSVLPTTHIVDMREELKHENFSMFSNLLKEKIDHALKNKQQIILFLNKRGHTSYVFCRSCGYVHRCEACDVAMTYHKHNDRLVCHFCGRTHIKKKVCENCGSSYIKEFGAGTEKLEEETRSLFPEARIFRMDADTVSNKSHYEQVYNKMLNQEIDILIGTQMLAKGLDFPNVTVVGVMAADISLNLPDYKSGEKTYQLITQVSGRAGRGEKHGDVIIQTYKPSNYAIQTSANNDYYGFFKMEIQKRKKFSYPPFQNILIINFSSKNRNHAVSYANYVIKKIIEYNRLNSITLDELTGPTPSVIERINNYYRFNIILKNSNLEILLNIGSYIKENIEKNNEVYVNYSINPDSVY